MAQALSETGQPGTDARRALARPKFESVEEERLHRKQKLAGALRLFGRFGFSEGVAGHITGARPGTDRPLLGEPLRHELPSRPRLGPDPREPYR